MAVKHPWKMAKAWVNAILKTQSFESLNILQLCNPQTKGPKLCTYGAPTLENLAALEERGAGSAVLLKRFQLLGAPHSLGHHHSLKKKQT